MKNWLFVILNDIPASSSTLCVVITCPDLSTRYEKQLPPKREVSAYYPYSIQFDRATRPFVCKKGSGKHSLALLLRQSTDCGAFLPWLLSLSKGLLDFLCVSCVDLS